MKVVAWNVRRAGRLDFVCQVNNILRNLLIIFCFYLKQKSMRIDLWIFCLRFNLSVLIL